MRRVALALFLVFTIVLFLPPPLHTGEFAPLFPRQGAQWVSTPQFVWSAGEFDYFVLCLLMPIPGHWYTPIPIRLYRETALAFPQTPWDYVRMDRWTLWLVLGLNTADGDWAVTP